MQTLAEIVMKTSQINDAKVPADGHEPKNEERGPEALLASDTIVSALQRVEETFFRLESLPKQ